MPTSVDYRSVVGTTTSLAVARGWSKVGPWAVHDLFWVFYPNGTDFVLRTKQVASGGTWSAETVIVAGRGSDAQVDVAFDGEFFHFAYNSNTDNDTSYRRGLPNSDGSITLDAAVTAWTDATWNASSTNRFSISVDENRHVWITQRVDSGSDIEMLVLANVNTSGGWTSRAGWPKNLQGSSVSGHANPNVSIWAGPGQMLFLWQDMPNSRNSAMLWTEGATPTDEGTLGSIEHTQLLLASNGQRTSLARHPDGEIFANRVNRIARRNTDGSWTDVSTGLPEGEDFQNSDFNSLSIRDGVVRYWDSITSAIRFNESTDKGATWSTVANKWNPANVQRHAASHLVHTQGDYHAVLWTKGTVSPYDVEMGVVGTVDAPASGPSPAVISEETAGKDDHHLRVSIDSVDAAATHRLWGHTSDLGADPATWESTATDLGAVAALDVVTWGGRTGETQYHFRVVSTEGTDKVVSNALSATTAPPRPTGFSAATGTEPGEIAWAWTNSATTADAIRIYFRVALSSDPYDVEVAAGDATTHVSTGLSGDYEAFATAINADGESGPSGTDSATAATDGDPPAAISDLAATAVSHERIDLTWTLPADTTGVRIHRAVTTGFTPGGGNQIADLGAVSAYQDTTGLSAETAYFYKAVAYNGAGDAPASNEATATTLEEPPPASLEADLTPDLMARIL